MKRLLLFCVLILAVFPAFSQIIVIKQNNTKDHIEFGTIAFILNSALLNNDIQDNKRLNLKKCHQTIEQVEKLSAKFRKLYPGVHYGTPNIVLPTTHTSDTITYEQTYVRVKKKKLIYYLQLKVTFDGNNPDGEYFYPYITNIEVKGPNELTTHDTAIMNELKLEKEQRRQEK